MSELVRGEFRYDSTGKAGHKRGIDENIDNANTAIDDAVERFSVATHRATWDTPSNITRVPALNSRKLAKTDTSVGGGLFKRPEKRERTERDEMRRLSIERTVERIQLSVNRWREPEDEQQGTSDGRLAYELGPFFIHSDTILMLCSVESPSPSALFPSGSQTSSRSSIASTDTVHSRHRHVLQVPHPSADEGPRALWVGEGNLNRRDRPTLSFLENTIADAETYVPEGVECILCEEGRSHHQCVTEDILKRRKVGDLSAGIRDPCLDCFGGYPHDFIRLRS